MRSANRQFLLFAFHSKGTKKMSDDERSRAAKPAPPRKAKRQRTQQEKVVGRSKVEQYEAAARSSPDTFRRAAADAAVILATNGEAKLVKRFVKEACKIADISYDFVGILASS